MKKTITACAVTALVVGGGTATASKLVTGGDIKDDSLTSADLRNETVRSRDIRDGHVREQDLSEGLQALLAGQAANGKTGIAGPAGPKGDTGAAGPEGPRGRDAITEVAALDGSQGWSVSEDGGATAGIEDGMVRLGSFPTGTGEFAGIHYDGLNGKKLSDISVAKFAVMSSGGAHHWLPYMYITTAEGSVVFLDPNYDSAPTPTFASGQWVRWDGLANTIVHRDASGPANFTWNGLIKAHGDETITKVSIGNGEEVRAAGTTSYVDNVEFEVAGQPLQFDFVGGSGG